MFSRTVVLLSLAGVCVVSYCPRTDQIEIAGQLVVKVSSVEQVETDTQTDRQTKDLPKSILHEL